MKAGIEITNDRQEPSAFYNDLVRKPLASNILVRLSNFDERKALLSFDDEIGKNFRKNIVEQAAAGVPSIHGPFIGFLTCPSAGPRLDSSKKIFQPVNDAFVAARNHELTVPLGAVPVFSLFNAAKIKATLAVNYAGKVRKLLRGLIGRKVNYFCHKNSFIYDWLMINEKLIGCHRERLSVLAP